MPLIESPKFGDFRKAYKISFQMMYLNSKFRRGHNLSFFGLGPWAIIIHGIAKLANTFIVQIRNLMMLFERCVSKLSENNIIVEIGSTEFELWQLIN